MKITYSDALSTHNVRKIRQEEGELMEVLGLRLNWKIKAKDTGYAFSIYEAELAPGQGIPMHLHPYGEFFFILEGSLDVERIGSDSRKEWLRAHAGESVLIPINAPHSCSNRTEKPVKFMSTSTYYHEAIFNEVGVLVNPEDKIKPLSPQAAQQFTEVSAKYQGFFVEADDSGRLLEDAQK